VDVAAVTAVKVLVAGRGVNPVPPGGVQVDRPHAGHFIAAHSGEELKLDHRPHLAGDVALDGGNVGFRHGPDRLRLARLAPPVLEPRDGAQPFEHQ
jgi:hypothetical protein